MPYPRIIAIDGPAASGKSTIAGLLAQKIGYLFFDTGLMYRAVTWAALNQSIATEDEHAISELANAIEIDVQPCSLADGRTCDVVVNGRDITWEIRKPEVEALVSQVSAYPQVRRAMTDRQRKIGLRGQVVMVGRDIGTVVFPEAELKIYLDATVEERARRRYEEVISRGNRADYDEILVAMRRRDQIDSTRVVAPLKPAVDSIRINTDGQSISQVLKKVCELLVRKS